MEDFTQIYNALNAQQKEAVDTIYGPMLVIAGPGTGKTQLLSARVANILRKTDTLPNNILCLTFTENGARNMRERLTSFIGQDAQDVNIHTYHAFGSSIIGRFSQYFSDLSHYEPIDDLTKHQIVESIVVKLPFSNPIKQTQYHLNDLVSTISELKRANLDEEAIKQLARKNMQDIATFNSALANRLLPQTMPRSVSKCLPVHESILQTLQESAAQQNTSFGVLQLAINDLQKAIPDANNSNSTKPLTAWKNTWLEKNADNNFILKGEYEAQRLAALAKVFKTYQEQLSVKQKYDYDDMILHALQALKQHDDLRYSLHEQYQFILLDEFQDTNAAQMQLVEQLTNNPAQQGKPNVMAVGDDDQAIYAFQGALYSNMLDFYNTYTDTKLVTLNENYRSSKDILLLSQNIAQQINERLVDAINQDKKLNANARPKNPMLQRVHFATDSEELWWVSEQIASLQQKGVPLEHIAVLAPKHTYLKSLVPFLNHHQIPVAYEKREDVLTAPLILQLTTILQLLLALRDEQVQTANSLWPEVLSYPFWGIPAGDIWQISWNKDKDTHWTQAACSSDSSTVSTAANLLTRLSLSIDTSPAEDILDILTGAQPLDSEDDTSLRSPLKDFLQQKLNDGGANIFYELLSQLKVIRQAVRTHQSQIDQPLSIRDVVSLIASYKAAGVQLLHTIPHKQSDEAVQMMTVYKSKGLEFEHVFLLHCVNEVWGSKSRSNNNKLTLPANLQHIRHSGANDDERLRTLFVAITRARSGLYLSSYSHSFSGRSCTPLLYFDERITDDSVSVAHALPSEHQVVQELSNTPPEFDLLNQNNAVSHLQHTTELKDLLSERLLRYKLSPTHLNGFVDLVYGGPEAFFMNTILRFPKAPGANGQYGNAIHETLQWYQNQLLQKLSPSLQKAEEYFSKRLAMQKMTHDQFQIFEERGKQCLKVYLQQKSASFTSNARPEYDFSKENVMFGEVKLGGKIDRIDIDTKNKTLRVIDYKTGTSYNKWASTPKLHKYKQQLYCYKLLIEQSASFRGFTVESLCLEFVEPNKDGNIDVLELAFKQEEYDHIKQLITAMWQRVISLEFPDISNYPPTLKGIKQFESDLLENT